MKRSGRRILQITRLPVAQPLGYIRATQPHGPTTVKMANVPPHGRHRWPSDGPVPRRVGIAASSVADGVARAAHRQASGWWL